jgi:hypothetical protein
VKETYVEPILERQEPLQEITGGDDHIISGVIN